MAELKDSTIKPKKKRHFPIPALCLIIIATSLVIAFFIFFIYMKQQTDPDHILDRYITTFMSKDISALHAMIGFEDSPFLNAESFGKSMEECHQYSSITNYALTKYQNPGDPDQVEYVLQYWTDRRQNPYTQTLKLRRAEKKQYLFFDNWLIDNSEFLARGCQIKVPAQALVTVDGVELSKDQIRENEGSLCLYEIGDLYTGKHQICVTIDGFKPYSTETTLQNADYSAAPLYNITMSLFSLTKDTKKQLENTAKNLLKDLYSLALDEKGFEDLAQKHTFEDSQKSALEQAYNTLVANNINSGSHLTDINFREFESSSTGAYAEDHCYAVNVTTNVDYTVSSSIIKNTPSSGGTSPEPVTQSRTTNSSSLFTTTFHYNAGAWSVYSSTMFDTSVYYIKY